MPDTDPFDDAFPSAFPDAFGDGDSQEESESSQSGESATMDRYGGIRSGRIRYNIDKADLLRVSP